MKHAIVPICIKLSYTEMQDMKIVLGSILRYTLEAPIIAMASTVLITTFCAELLSTAHLLFTRKKIFSNFETTLNPILPHILFVTK